MTRFFKRLAIVLLSIGAPVGASTKPFLPTAPAGFSVSVYAKVPNARQMALSPASGNLYVGSMEAGQVHVVVNGSPRVLLEKLTHPSGVAWH